MSILPEADYKLAYCPDMFIKVLYIRITVCMLI